MNRRTKGKGANCAEPGPSGLEMGFAALRRRSAGRDGELQVKIRAAQERTTVGEQA